MDNLQIVWVIIGSLVIFLLYGLYYQSRPRRNKATTTVTSEPKPKSTMMESPKETVSVDLIHEVVPKSTLIEASKDDAVNLAPEVVGQSVINKSNAIDEPVDVIHKVVPKSTLIEASKDDAVNPVLEVAGQSTINESKKIDEPVDVIHEIVPKSTLIEDSVTEPVKLILETVPQNAKVETPIKAESSHLEDVKIKQTGSLKESKKSTPKTRDHGSKIIDVESIGQIYAEKLNSIGIYTTSDLLESGATLHGRKELAEKTDIAHNLILEWVNLSDLLRIKGIGEEYSDLLEEAGVDTVVELSHRNAVNLHAHVLEVNMAKKLVRRPPSLSMVERWIRAAKDLPRKIEY